MCLINAHHNMDRGSERSHAIEGVLQQLIDEETLGVCFEMHRAIKLRYFDLLYPDKNAVECHEVIDQPGCDVFGNTIQMLRKPVECVCPSCNRTLGASKFAPHLEKCLGMGRGRSRLAHKRTVAVETEGEGSEDNEEEWTYPEKKSRKQLKKDKMMLVSPRKMTAAAAAATAKPSKRDKGGVVEGVYSSGGGDSLHQLKQHNVASFSALSSDYQVGLLQQICAVVSERTGRLCTRSVNCPQHSEEQRSDVRRRLLDMAAAPLDIMSPSPPSSSSSSSSSSSLMFFKDSSSSSTLPKQHVRLTPSLDEESLMRPSYDALSYDDKPAATAAVVSKKSREVNKKLKKHSSHHSSAIY